MSLDLLSVAMPEARDFVESLEPYFSLRAIKQQRWTYAEQSY